MEKNKVRILLVEDDIEICEILQFYLLSNTDYELTIAHSAEAALPLVMKRTFQLILLDIMLSGMDGIEFCKELRKTTFCPIIFISCINDDETIIRALNMGGDDYLVKPFQAPVLLARIEANLRRCGIKQETDLPLTNGTLTLYPNAHKVTKEQTELDLSPTEYAILAYLMEHPGVFISFDELYRAVWQRPSLGDFRALYVHITHLRQKIEKDPSRPVYIRTHQRNGYLFGV